MDINEILSDLGLDLSNPETRKGALDAIKAILDSRTPLPSGAGGGMGGTGQDIDIEIDPDLIQPSQKHQPPMPEGDFEIEDEEDILSQVKQNKPTGSDNDSSTNQETGDGDKKKTRKTDTGDTDPYNKHSDEDEEKEDDNIEGYSDGEGEVEGEVDGDSEGEGDSDGEGEIEAEVEGEGGDVSGTSGDLEGEDTDTEGSETDGEDGEWDSDGEFLDDTLKQTYTDPDLEAKRKARRIKRERTLEAAKKVLHDAKARKASPAKIKELENAIAALEALTESVKSIDDVSDEEFNRLLNRVFDAIEEVGGSDLSFTTDEERKTRAQEIKQDLADEKTRTELSAEDAARIRAETQATKAREKEVDKYRARSSTSFKGFEDFLGSLYRAIARQVSINDEKENSWNALSRRNRGDGVIQQGKKTQEVRNDKIPIIDFYFDQSGSWSTKDIAVGNKAVSALADMEAKGKIKINIYYFSDDVYTDAAMARAAGGTSGWNEIVRNIIATRANNVVIMTDSDMENWWNGPEALRYKVPGCVWYLWRNGSNAPRLPRDLQGRGGTLQYSFNT